MICPQCGASEFNALYTTANGLRLIVNGISYSIIILLMASFDPPTLPLRRHCRNCGFTGRERPDVSAYCPRCGYNISGNPTGACPECGHPPRATKKPPSSGQSDEVGEPRS